MKDTDKKNEVLENYKKLIKEAIEELKTPGKRHKQIPNILTTLRLFAPVLIIPAAAVGNMPLTVGMAIAFGLTDAADGFIARHWELTSELGKDLDALADKLFAGTLLIAASFVNPLLLLNVGLEMGIAGINLHQKSQNKEAKSTYMGKAKTVILFILAALGIAVPAANEMGILNALSLATAGMQGLTIASYLKQYQEPDTQDNAPKPKKKKKNESKMPELQVDRTGEKVKVINHGPMEATPKEKEASQEELLDQLKEMREFLHQEQQNQLVDEQPQAVNADTTAIQMTKKDRRS